MKKLFSVCLIFLLAISAMAQRAAVMEFKAGVGISQADVDGLSGIFTTYFRPSGYTMIERTQIDRIIDEQKLQRSSLTESQMVRIGELLNLSKIVIGDVNIVMGQYNVDVRVINVESGTIAATEGATFAGSSYREGMKNLATKLASQIAIGADPMVSTDSAQPSSTSQNQTNVITLLNYLHIFPENLGTFEEVPRHIILHLNQSQQYGYGSWRLPTEEELSLMRANNLIGYGNYMTCENQKGIVRLVTDKEAGVIITDGEYIVPKNMDYAVSVNIEDEETVYKVVESMPEFPGGQQAILKFLAENIQYPVIAMENGIQGRVICQIVIEKDGSITNVKVAQSSGEPFLDKEAIRVLTSMPKWKPGRHREELVRVQYTIPINFRLEESASNQ